MQKLIVFNSVSLDGYFVDAHGDMSWAKGDPNDTEWNEFVSKNASGGGSLLFGRKTYQMMESFWPTPMAKQMMPMVAEAMNNMVKIVFSRTLNEVAWNNTRLLKGNLVEEVRKLKEESGEGITILGSGTIVAQLAPEGLIDEYQFVIIPVVLGKGRTMFEGLGKNLKMKLTQTRTFKNGNVYLTYQEAK